MRMNRFFVIKMFFIALFGLNILSTMVVLGNIDIGNTDEFYSGLLRGFGIPLDIDHSQPIEVPRLIASDEELIEVSKEAFGPINPQVTYTQPSWGGVEFEFRKNITIDASKVAANLNGFPVMIELYKDPDLWGVRQVSGNDILFADIDGNKLPHEIELFDQNQSHLIAWVKADLAGSTNTVISMYFGSKTASNQQNPSGVWDSNYDAVWHLSEDPTEGLIYDSTLNNHDGTPAGAMTSSDQVNGQIDGSLDFDGNDDHITIGQVTSNSWTAITVEAWIRMEDTGDDRVLAKEEGTGSGPYIFILGKSGSNLKCRLTTDGTGGGYTELQPSGGLIVGKWQHIAFTWSSITTAFKGFIDGANIATLYRDGDSILNSVENVIIADMSYFARQFRGIIDEVRISRVARSNEWISTQYNNQYDPLSFYSVSSLEYPKSYEMFRYYKTITIDHTKVSGTSDLTNFPFLIEIYDSDLHDPAKVAIDGSNLVFMNLQNGQLLNYEIETFDQAYNGSHAYLIAWIKLDTLYTGKDTKIGMFYGNDLNWNNPNMVWSDYMGVYHLGESVTDEGTVANVFQDSTINDYDGDQYGSDDISGKIGSAQSFDGVNDYIDMGDVMDIADPEDGAPSENYYTVSGWFYRDTTSSIDVIVEKGGIGTENWLTGFTTYIDNADGYLHLICGDNDDDGTQIRSTSNFNSLPTGWYHFAITFNTAGETAGFKIFINGQNDNGVVSTFGNGGGYDGNGFSHNEPFIVGAHSINKSNGFDGRLDEIRFTNITLSTDRIITEYNNQDDPSAFYSISPEVETANWWKEETLSRRKDITLNNTLFSQINDGFLLIPAEPGTSTSFSRSGAITDYLAVDDIEPDDASSYIYTNINYSARYTYFISDGLPSTLQGTINSITFYSRARVSSTTGLISSSTYIQPYVFIGGTRYYGQYRSSFATTSFTTYSSGADSMSSNPSTGQPWTWDDLNKLGFGIRGRVTFTGSPIQLQITQLYIVVDYQPPSHALYDYPLMLEIYDADLKINAQVNGDDIVFYDEFGRKLDHEIITYDPSYSPSEAHLVTFVSVPFIRTDSSSLFAMYYGNTTTPALESPDQVWTDGYASVWHLDETLGGTNSIIDSSPNNNDGTDYGSPNFSAIGQIGSSIGFDDVDDNISVNDASSLRFEEYITVEAWINPDVVNDWQTIVSKMVSQTENLYFAISDTSNLYIGLAPVRSDWSTSINIQSGIWQHVAFTYDGMSIRAYKNGVLGDAILVEGTLGLGTNDHPLFLGWNEGWTNELFDGYLDEIYLSNTPRSPIWINFQYQNHYNRENFFTLGNEYVVEPIVLEFGVDDLGDGFPTFWANVTNMYAGDLVPITSVQLHLDTSDIAMSKNASGYWIYTYSATFGTSHSYSINDAVNEFGLHLPSPTSTEGITFDYDKTMPTVETAQFFAYLDDPEIGNYVFEFLVNVSDLWGILDTIMVNVTNVGGVERNDLIAVMQSTPSGFFNNTLDIPMDKLITYEIIANDTKGNVRVAVQAQEYVPFLNHLPVASALTLSREFGVITLPIFSNSTLYLDYTFSDYDIGDTEQGTEIRWYKNTVLQPAFNDLTLIPSSELIKGHTWYATVRPKDSHGDFGFLQTSPSVTIKNTAPQLSNIAILPASPKTTSTLTVTFTYFDTDSDSESTGDREIRWYKDGILQTNLNDSNSVPASLINKSQQWYYRIRVFDGFNYSTWENSSPVTVQNSAPTASGLTLTSNPTSLDNLVAGWSYTDADLDPQDTNNWIIRWYKDGVLQSDLNDKQIVESGNTSRGELWYYTLQVYDGESYSIVYTFSPSRQIINARPEARNAIILTTSSYTDSDLEANWTYHDLENDSVDTYSWTILWYKNGVRQSAYDNEKILPASVTSRFDIWNFTIVVNDGFDDSLVYNSSSVRILNSFPTAIGISITSAPKTTDNIVASWTFSDLDPEDSEQIYTITWYRNNSIFPNGNAKIVPYGETFKNQNWSYTLIVNDGKNNSILYYSSTVFVVNSNPYVINPTFNQTTGITSADDVEIVYTYNDADNLDNPLVDLEDIDQRVIHWYTNGVYNNTKDNHTILYNGDTRSGQFWYYIIWVHDGTSLSIAYTSIYISIGSVPNTAPEASSLSLTPINPTNLSILTASYSYYDANGHVESGTEIRWYRDGVLIPELNDLLEVPASLTSKGEVWNFTVRPKDGLAFGIQQNSSTVTILNSVPTLTGVTITSIPKNTTDLTASAVYQDADNDGEALREIRWYKDGVLQSVYNNNPIVPALATSKGQVWNFTIRVYDGENYSIYYTSSITTILNTIPIASNLALTSNPQTLDNLVLIYSYTDADNDLEGTAWIIRWYKNFVVQTELNDKKLIEFGNTSKNQVWFCTLQVYDGEQYSNIYTSPQVQIQNTAPTILGSVIINPTDPVRGDALIVQYSYSDVDGDNQAGTQIFWYKNDVLQPTYNDLTTIPGSEVIKGDFWHAKVILSDGTDYGTPINSTTYQIGNTAPIVTDKPSIDPSGAAYTTTTLFAIYTYSDPDNDPITEYRIKWYKSNGTHYNVEITALANSTNVPAIFTTKGDSWTFTVEVWDGEDWSSPNAPISGRFIQNSEPTIINPIFIGGENTSTNVNVAYTFIDADNDPEGSTTIEWWIISQLGSSQISGSDELDYTNFIAGNLIYCVIRPHDTEEFGAYVTTTSFPNGYVIIGNSQPVITIDDITIIGIFDGVEYQGEEYGTLYYLLLTYNATDIDGDQGATAYGLNEDEEGYALGSKYRWFRNRSAVVELIAEYNDETIMVDVDLTQEGDYWWVEVTPIDFLGLAGNSKNSTPILIGNTPPQILSPSFPLSIYYTDNDLEFSYTYFDVDNDPEFSIITRWYLNGTLQGLYNDWLSLPSTETSKNQEWKVQIQVSDGEAVSLWVELIVLIYNKAPSFVGLPSITPITAYTLDNLSLEWEYSDADGDPEKEPIILWYLNGGLMVDLNGSEVIEFGSTTKNDRWQASIRLFDGTEYSIQRWTNFIIIQNSIINISSVEFDDTYLSGVDTTFANSTLSLIWDFLDNDGDIVQDTRMRWFNYTGGLFVEVPSLENVTSLDSSYLKKGQFWKCELSLFDGDSWSAGRNTSIMEIVNAPPQILNPNFPSSIYYADNELAFGFTYNDVDNDPQGSITTYWCLNGTIQPLYNNTLILPSSATLKNQEWKVFFRVSDGQVNSSWVELTVLIYNKAPTLVSQPLISPINPDTSSDLILGWTYSDVDGDPENVPIIVWYRNGELIGDLNGSIIVGAGNTTKNDLWKANIWIFDGFDYSNKGETSVIIIQNSPIQLTTVTFDSTYLTGAENTFANSTLSLIWTFSDSDPDLVLDIYIRWFNCTGGEIVEVLGLENITSLSSSYLKKGQLWKCELSLFDGDDWSTGKNTSIMEIVNAPPEIHSVTFDNSFDPTSSQIDVDVRTSVGAYFLVEDEDIILSFSYYDIDGDFSQSLVRWFTLFPNGTYIERFEYENLTVIDAQYISPGEIWNCSITPFDGFEFSATLESAELTIESRPIMEEYMISPLSIMEGRYNIVVNATQLTHMYLTLNDGQTTDLPYTRVTGNSFLFEYQLSNLGLLDTVLTGQLIASRTVRYASTPFTIYSVLQFNFTLFDEAPPRVIGDPRFTQDDDANPTSLQFTAEIQEFGSGIASIILYYYFEEIIEEAAGFGATYVQVEWHMAEMTLANSSSASYFYTATVPFLHNNSEWNVIFRIATQDNAGNSNPAAYNILDHPNLIEKTIYTPPGISPELVLIIVAGVIIFAGVSTGVYIKFIRKPELIGLDKELVVEKIKDIDERQIGPVLDVHSLGIIVSFFDQRHGPIPIIVLPEILKDNFTKLVELSDRSFSGTGFSDDFNSEVPSSYDFVLAQSLRVGVISYGFALDRPEARGNRENLTLNVLIHKDFFPLLSQFQDEIQERVHKVHVLMNNNPTAKEEIRKSVFEIRHFLSAVILSYQEIYGTTELIDED